MSLKKTIAKYVWDVDFSSVYVWQQLMFILACNICGGMCPFYVRRVNGGEFRWFPSKPRFANVTNILVILVVVSSAQYKCLELAEGSDPLSYYAAIVQAASITLIVLFIQITFLFKHESLLKALDCTREIDLKLRDLDIFVTYKPIVKIAYSLPAFLWGGSFILLATNSSSFTKMFYSYWGYTFPLIVRFSSNWFPTNGFAMTAERFYQLHQALEKLDDEVDDFSDDENVKNTEKRDRDDGDLTAKRKRAEFVLETVAMLHADVVAVNEHIMDSTQIIILLNIIYNLVHFILGIYFSFLGTPVVMNHVEMQASTAVLSLQMSLLYLLGYTVEYLSNDILVTLGYYSVLYSTEKLATTRNTFLLQAKHVKINTQILGLFPLNMSIFLKQMSFCNVFILMLLQYDKNYQKEASIEEE